MAVLLYKSKPKPHEGQGMKTQRVGRKEVREETGISRTAEALLVQEP